MEIKTVATFNEALECGPYAWPGGYPLYFITRDGGVLSFDAAKERAAEIRDAIAEPRSNAQWEVCAIEINWEDSALFCDHTGARIKSAYAEDEAQA